MQYQIKENIYYFQNWKKLNLKENKLHIWNQKLRKWYKKISKTILIFEIKLKLKNQKLNYHLTYNFFHIYICNKFY